MMGINVELARKAEAEARKICREIGQPESLWQMVLHQAYDRLCPMPPRTPDQEPKP